MPNQFSQFVVVDMFARVCTGQATIEESITQAVTAAKAIFNQ